MMELKATFVGCPDGDQRTVSFFKHPTADVALLHFENYTNRLYDATAVFPSDTTDLKSGKFLCRLGFPFPQFTNFEYDASQDTISWTKGGHAESPWFPLEGMVTRIIVAKPAEPSFGFEMSTPGLKGQSGGPVFDAQGRVWGMQFATTHLDLDFDVNLEVLRKWAEEAG